MEVKNIVAVEEYEKNGETRKTYNQVGKLLIFEKDGRPWYQVKLNMFPGLVYNVYDQKRSYNN